MPLVAPVAVVLLALFALLLFYGMEKFAQSLEKLIPDWSIPGLGNLRSGVSAIINAGLGAAQRALESATAPAISLLTTLGLWTLRQFEGLVTIGTAAAGALHRLWNNALPALILRVQTWTHTLIRDAIGLLTVAIDALRRNVFNAIDAARAYARTLVASAVSIVTDGVNLLRVNVWVGINEAKTLAHTLVAVESQIVHAELGAVRVFTVQGLAGVEHQLGGAIVALEARVVTGVKAAEAFAAVTATAAAAEVAHSITVAVHAGAATLDGLVSDDIPALLGALATDFPDLQALLAEIDLSDIATLAGTLGISAVMARVLSRYLTRCGIPNCRNLSGMGRFIGELGAAASMAGLVGLLVEIVEHPEQAARTVAADIQAPMHAARTLARDLIGVG